MVVSVGNGAPGVNGKVMIFSAKRWIVRVGPSESMRTDSPRRRIVLIPVGSVTRIFTRTLSLSGSVEFGVGALMMIAGAAESATTTLTAVEMPRRPDASNAIPSTRTVRGVIVNGTRKENVVSFTAPDVATNVGVKPIVSPAGFTTA